MLEEENHASEFHRTEILSTESWKFYVWDIDVDFCEAEPPAALLESLTP